MIDSPHDVAVYHPQHQERGKRKAKGGRGEMEERIGETESEMRAERTMNSKSGTRRVSGSHTVSKLSRL